MRRRRTIGVVLAGFLASAIITWHAAGRVNGWTASRAGFAQALAAGEPVPRLTARDSVVVFAAHPDDETLGAGGLLHAAAAAAARVHLVFFTNGDGYLEGVDVGFRTLLSTPGRFIEYGRRRQQEALRAAQRLGLSPDRLTFLGYPDRGLAVLWGSAWGCGRPYTSPYTRRSASPYAIAFRPGVAYCGRHVLEDVESVLRRDRPTVIVTHSPDDVHRDHWAAGAFVIAAVERSRAAGAPWTEDVQLQTYLVHHPRWPQPEAYAPDLPLAPPADLGTPREDRAEFPLRPEDEAAKRAAVLEYHSQLQVLRGYLLSFVRRNELFGALPVSEPEVLASGALPIAQPETWDRLPARVVAAPVDLLGRATQGSLRIRAVAVAQDRDHLFVAVRLRRAALREAQYRVSAALLYPDQRLARLRLLFRPPATLTALRSEPWDVALPLGSAGRSFGPRIHLSVPFRGMGRPASLVLYVETIGPLHRPVERSPWIVVRLDRARGVNGARPRSASAPGYPQGRVESSGVRGGLPE